MSAPAARFAGDCAGLVARGEGLGIAVSGGPDSLALLLLAHRAFPGRIRAATVDHGLRAESADEAAMVSALCRARGIAHETLTVTVPGSGNLQANARGARYRALGEWARASGLGIIATAHHVEDVAETLIMRLNRGAGLKGLAAMQARRPLPGGEDIALIRPLLTWRRNELAAICTAAGVAPVQDPSNSDPRFTRARVRMAMADADWLDPARFASSAHHLRDALAVVEGAVTAEYEARVSAIPGGGTLYRPSPCVGAHAIRFGVLERVFSGHAASATPPRGTEIEALLATLESGGIGTLGGLRCSAHDGGNGPEWRFTLEPPRKTG